MTIGAHRQSQRIKRERAGNEAAERTIDRLIREAKDRAAHQQPKWEADHIGPK